MTSDDMLEIRNQFIAQMNQEATNDEYIDLRKLLQAYRPPQPTRLESYAWRSAQWFMDRPLSAPTLPGSQRQPSGSRRQPNPSPGSRLSHPPSPLSHPPSPLSHPSSPTSSERVQEIKEALRQLLMSVAQPHTDRHMIATSQLLELSDFVQQHPVQMTDSSDEVCIAFRQVCAEFDLFEKARSIQNMFFIDDYSLGIGYGGGVSKQPPGAGLSPNVPKGGDSN